MSAQKQCPKCGEKNPAEAVMCWACYTSLTGGVTAAGGLAAPGAAPLAMADSGEKKKIEPKQLAIIGVGLVVLLGVGATVMMGGGETEPDDVAFTSGAAKSTNPNPAPAATTPPPVASTVVAGGPAPGAPAVAQVPQRFPYQMLGSPNPNASTATVAIVPTENDLTEGQARGLATFAHRQISRAKKWPAVEIFVFNDVPSAQAFATYQNKNLRTRSMSDGDYTNPQLAALWPKAIVRYYSRNERVWVTSPRGSSGNFWKSGAASS